MSKTNGNDSARGILLDFASILDPLILLESLIIYRQTHKKIFLAEHSVSNIAFMWFRLGFEDYYDLREADILNSFDGHLDLNSTILANWNLPLAIKLLQHSIREGFIEVLPSNYDALGIRFLKESGLPTFGGAQIFEFSFQNLFLTISPDIPQAFASDVGIVLRNNLHASFSNPNHKFATNDPLTEKGILKKIKDGTLSHVLEIWRPNNFNEIYGLIAEPKLLPDIVNAAKEVTEDQAFKNDLLLFVPRFLADMATGGVYSVCEMAYKIYRKKFSSHSKKSDS